MSSTLYMQIEPNVAVTNPHVYLQDIAKLLCTDQKILDSLRVLPVVDFSQLDKKQAIISIVDLNQKILQKEPDIDIESLGDENFIITYQKQKPSTFLQWLKVIFVCFGAFFGSAFSIMTFNRDADVGSLFQQIYTQVTGKISNGFTVLEISYSLGIGIGVLFFFNHFGKWKFSDAPTPLQVQMCQYENNVNTTVIKQTLRSDKK